MSVVAIGDYKFPPADTVDKFHGNQVLYVSWDKHLMFCAPFALPLPPTISFGSLLKDVLPGSFGYHPDFRQIDWNKVTWIKSGQPWQPDYSKSLAENGLVHKDLIRFQTPGLNGIKGSGN